MAVPQGDATWLPSRREEVGLSLRQLARESGVSAGMISRIERGERASKALLGRLASSLKMTEDHVLVLSGYAPDWLLKALRERPELLGQIKTSLRR